jgi:cystathionine gamma-lyase
MNDIYTNAVKSPAHPSSLSVHAYFNNDNFQNYKRSLISGSSLSDLEQNYAKLEQSPYAVAFDTYISAIRTLLFTLLYKNDHLLVFNDIHCTTRTLLNELSDEYHIDIEYINYGKDLILERYFKPTTRVLWLESPGEITYQSYDISTIARTAHKNNILVVVGNSLLTPYFQKPVLWGADIVVHNISRYISGHSSVSGGAVMLQDGGWYGRIKYNQTVFQYVPKAFDRYIILRDIKNLEKHLIKRQANAKALATFLKNHPAVETVFYAHSFNNPDIILGGIVSFTLKYIVNELDKLIEQLSFGILEENFTGSETRISLPAMETDHNGNSLWLGVAFNLIKVSLGTEEPETIIEKFNKGLNLILE